MGSGHGLSVLARRKILSAGDREFDLLVAPQHSPCLFAPEIDPQFFHGGATSSFKEIRFGEANIQLTFHENDKKTIGGESCIKVEPDRDYYKDLLAHALLEVVANHLANSLTDPVQVYVLCWIAGRRAGLPEFDPPYTLVG